MRVLLEQPFLLQEFGVVAVGGGLEEAVVENVSQGLGERAQHLLLGLPHGGVRVEAQTFLGGWGGGGLRLKQDFKTTLKIKYPLLTFLFVDIFLIIRFIFIAQTDTNLEKYFGQKGFKDVIL